MRMSGSIDCDTQMPSSEKVNLLDHGVVDTLVSVGAMGVVDTSVFIHPSRESLRPALREAVNKTRVSNDDGNQLQQHEWPGNIWELQNVIERADILSKSPAIAADRHQGMMDVCP
jgi:hypothetical protein